MPPSRLWEDRRDSGTYHPEKFRPGETCHRHKAPNRRWHALLFRCELIGIMMAQVGSETDCRIGNCCADKTLIRPWLACFAALIRGQQE